MILTNDILQQILDSVHVHALIFRRNQIIMANSTTLAWLSLSSDTLLSHSLRDFIHQTSHYTALQSYDMLQKGETSVSVRVLIVHPSQGNVWVDATIKPADYFDTDDYYLVTFSPRGNFNTTHIDMAPEIELSVFNDDETIENNPLLTSVISENQFVDNALEEFLTTLRDIIPYDSASIALLENDIMRFIAARGLPKEIQLNDLTVQVHKHFSKSSEILYENSHGKVQVIQDTDRSPGWIKVPGIDHIKSWMGINLQFENKILGILNLDSAQPHFFTKDHARHALALSQQAILALVYTRLYKQFYNDYEERKRLQQILVKNLISTETMYAAQELLFSTDNFAGCLPDLLNIVGSSMDNTNIIVVIFNLATGNLTHKLQSQSTDTNLWAIFREAIKQPQLEDDTMPPQDLSFPVDGMIQLEDGTQITAAVVNRRGALLAVRDSKSEAFDETDHELIVTIANQVSIALENETLYVQLRQHTQHLERLVERRTSQLSVERKRLKAILDSTAEGIFYMENFKIQYANPAFCRMVGYDLDDLYGKPLSYVRVTPEIAEQHNFTTLLDNPMEVEPGRSETRLRHQDGAEFYASIRFSLVGQPGEDPVRMVAIARDISQERKLYIQRARFIANAAHELRTPLSSLILRLHMLRRQPERMSNHLESLDKVTNYLKELVEELLTLSRFERGSISLDKDEFILQELIHQATNEQLPFAEEQNVHVIMELPEEPVAVKVDGKRIHQMISNLVVNGINYSSQENTVKITMTLEIDPVGNKNAIIHVIDEGAGIEPELLPDDIFEPFSRPSGGTRKETGMGLALVREIVTLHGGSIHAKSKLGEGATFRVSLPLN